MIVFGQILIEFVRDGETMINNSLGVLDMVGSKETYIIHDSMSYGRHLNLLVSGVHECIEIFILILSLTNLIFDRKRSQVICLS